MKTYIEPNTIILSVATISMICAGSPTGNGDDPQHARTPGRRIGGLYI